MKLLRSSRPSLEVFGTCPDIYHLINIRSYSECFCDVARKSKFTLKRDVAKSLRIGPIIGLAFWHFAAGRKLNSEETSRNNRGIEGASSSTAPLCGTLAATT